jgi:filamentous hemagglutinin family protein
MRKRNRFGTAGLHRSALYTLGFGIGMPVLGANLPVPCISSSCGGTAWVTGGSVTATQLGTKLTVNQSTPNAILNWQSFNIASGNSVNFVQPSATSLAINNIFQGSPSQIFGSLTANGRIYLLNQNGILFGSGAQVNVGGLVASSLNLTQNAVSNGIATSVNGEPTSPSFVQFIDANGVALSSGNVTVAQGATLNSTNGQIFLFAPNVTNQGSINTPDGQSILAAGEAIYLATSSDPNVRGLTVAVDAGGNVTNGTASNAQVTDPAQLVGQIVAQRGNVTLVGLMVNQQGLISANTAVRANGTIKLIAADRATAGTLTLGANSLTEAPLDPTDTSQAVDQTVQQKSTVDLQGYTIDFGSGAHVVATSGDVLVAASSNGVVSATDPSVAPSSSISDGARIYMADGSGIDVSGATATLPMSANTLTVELRGSELADDPLQRNGPLRSQSVTVDVRQYGTAADGTQWVGTPLADLTGDLATIQRGVQARNESGGTVTLQSTGDVIVGNAKINVSGGASNYQAGFLNTSSLLTANGQVINVTNANPNVIYTGIANTTSFTNTDPRWGVTTTYTGIYGNGQGQFQSAYVQGADAGSLVLTAPHLLFDGTLTAATQIGPYQRKPPTALAVSQIVRPFDELPDPGALQIGSAVPVAIPFTPSDLIVPSIVFSSTPVLPTLEQDATPFDPLADPWPTDLTAMSLNPALIGAGAAGRINLQANGAIDLPAGIDLRLPVGGSLTALASSIDIAGRIQGPGAAVSLQVVPTQLFELAPTSLTLEPTASIDVAGTWVNDNPLVTPTQPTTALSINGGSVTLAAGNGAVKDTLTLSAGATVDVSGGAQQTASGKLIAGSAGSIHVSVAADNSVMVVPAELNLGATLIGNGMSEGGSLSLVASAFCITAAGACAQTSGMGTVTLAPGFFNTGGFASYSLSSNVGGIDLAAATSLQPVQRNYIVTNLLSPSAASLSAVATLGTLPDLQRQPVNLAFSAQYAPPPNTGGVTSQTFANTTGLVLEKGSSILLDPTGSLTLGSDTTVLDDASIVVPGGNIAMNLNANLSEPSYVPNYQIWIGPDAVLNVAGTVQAVANDAGNTQGSVLAGGTVSLTALRGSVETEPGSLIDVSGTSGMLDLPSVNSAGITSYKPALVGSAGGSLNVQAAESVLLSGTMQGASGSSGKVAGGSFALTLDDNMRYFAPDFSNFGAGAADPSAGFNFARLLIDVTTSTTPVAIGAGSALPTTYDGKAVVSGSALNAAGFDAVTLKIVSLDGVLGTPLAGAIQFDGNVTLNVGRSLTLDAANILSTGGTAVIGAPYVSLGQSTPNTQTFTTTPHTGTGILQVNSAMIDLTGTVALSGFDSVVLNSTGDIRAIGVQLPPSPGSTPAPQSQGSLVTSGNLDLTAQQIYPATLTDFAFTAGAGGTDNIDIHQAGGTAPALLLSAGGSLSFNAAQIEQGGTVRAPIGGISMNAADIVLADGSVTSTSADGAIIPFGTTQGGFDWVYPVGTGTLVYGTDGIPLPSQTVELLGASITIASSAKVDVKGGGDLLATEFVPGPTGTVDVLAGSGSVAGGFAIVPAAALQFAPTDPYYSSGAGIAANQSITLAGGGGIAAGTYAVLPARYALLPGAYYVTPESGYQDLSPGQSIAQPDGSYVVSGTLGYAGTALGASRASGFDVQPGTAVQNLAQYTLSGANSFFTSQASAADVTAQRLPQDAGYLAFIASNQLSLNASLEATPGSGGRGADLDITSSAIRVVDGASAPAPEAGVLDLDANSLSQLGAESILVGGLRSQSPAGVQISTQSSTVEVATGASVSAPELLLAASNSVTVDSGATVGASGSLPQPDAAIQVSGDGALLRVAAAGDSVITRTSATGLSGDVNLLAGSVVNAKGGTLEIDAARNAALGGTLQLAGGSLDLSGPQINLGAVPNGVTGGIALPTAVLNSLGVANLSLASDGAIVFGDGANLSGSNISLTTGSLQGSGTSPVSISAGNMLTLTGTESPVSGSGSGSGTLTMNAGSVTLKGGTLGVSGFTDTAIAAQGLLNISGSGAADALNVTGDLDLSAALLSADSGVNRTISASGNFSFKPAAQPATVTQPTQEPLGATVSVTAQAIAFDAAAQLHSGVLSLTATTGDVSLGATANIDLSGVNTSFGSVTVPSPGGSLGLHSQQGSVIAQAGSAISVAALDDAAADAGTLSVSAPNGALNLLGALSGRDANVTLDGQSLGNFAALESSLAAGGFSGNWNVRQRGAGDLLIPAGSNSAIDGRSINLSADAGSIDVEGTITSNAPAGGAITLSALNDVTVNGTLDARPTSAGDMNGEIELATVRGGVFVSGGATIEAYSSGVALQSAADGGLWIRESQGALSSLTGASPQLMLAGNLQNLNSVTLEGYKAYTNTSGTLGAADVSTSSQYYADASAFMATAPALLQALGSIKGPAPQIVPGIEIDSSQALTLTSAWDLSQWRFNGAPGVLTLRSSGDLNIKASLSDGFTGTSGAAAYVLSATTPSWSYRLIAGADLGSSDVMAVNSTGSGSLTVAAGHPATSGSGMTAIRTGTGSIDIAAADNVVLTNLDSVIYTAGVADGGTSFRRAGQLGGALYPTEGGDVSISAGNDVVGAVSPDLVTAWLWRVGNSNNAPAWTVNFADFEQGVGALGGGNITVTAGHDINDLGVSIPTIGLQTGGLTPALSQLQILNTGNISEFAGHDIAGGNLYVGNGAAVAVAGHEITESPTVSGLYPMILLGDAQVTLAGRAGATLAGVGTPTLLPQSTGQGPARGNNYSYFSTYSSDSSVSLQTLTGNAQLLNDTSSASALVGTYKSLNYDPNLASFSADPMGASAFRLYPGTVSVESLRGSIMLDNTMTLYPEANGSLNLLAFDDVLLGANANSGIFELIESNSDPALLPTPESPQISYLNVAEQMSILDSFVGVIQDASTPVHLTGNTPDSTVSHITALTGDVAANDQIATQLFFSAPAIIQAGEDVTNLSATFTNLQPNDVSAVLAGRNIVYPLVRGVSGTIAASQANLYVDGPGTFDMAAGGNVNLGTSGGITSRGNLANTGLVASGASVEVEAGVGDVATQTNGAYATFIQDYLVNSTAYNSELIAYMQPYLGGSPTAAQALAGFEVLPSVEQQPLLQTLFFDELRSSGRAAAPAGPNHNDFSRGYAAIDALFAGGLPAKGQTNPYAGDISLYFSRIYTLDGGGINLFAPGGLVNAGLATIPASFGVSKDPSQLGLVAQSVGDVNAYTYGDFEVNLSRVFAADGGNILVWSSFGNIDAGRGAKTAISAPPPTITYVNGVPTVVFPAALTGSGIQTLATTPGVAAGDVDLYAPNGVVNANDAGIVAGNLTIAATAVLGASNIKVSGVSVGVPVEASGLGASLSAASAIGSSASQSSSDNVQENANRRASATPVADAALNWLDVFVEGFGEDVCKASDVDCLKRQGQKSQ